MAESTRDSHFSVAQRMRSDWNERAREDAFYFVAFGRRNQTEAEFLATSADVVHGLEAELKRLPPADRRDRRALEIGCGPGRLMAPLSWTFGEVHGIDVSDEMIRLAMRGLHDIPNAFPRLTRGTDLGCYGDEMFDFVYSYAVFQHIPAREIVLGYLADARRVLKEGGVLRCQVNGLPKTAKAYTTWEGVRLDAQELAEFACAHDMQLLAVQGLHTQYLWTTMRKRPAGWFEDLATRQPEARARIRRVTNSHSGEPAVPAYGRFASFSVWVEGFPEDADLNTIGVVVDEHEAPAVYIGPKGADGLQQVNVMMPPEMRTGVVEVELHWFGKPITEPSWMRVIPPGPAVPRLVTMTDGVNLLSKEEISSRSVKLCFEELDTPDRVEVRVDGNPVGDLDRFCTDPVNQSFEFNFRLPADTRAGSHKIEIAIGARHLPPLPVEVVD